MTKLKGSQKLFIRPVRHVGRQTTPQRNATMEPLQPIDRLPGTEDREDKIRSKRESAKMTQMELLKMQPNFILKMPGVHSGAAIDRPETTKIPPIPDVVWHQPQKTHLIDKHNKSSDKIKQKFDIEAQTSPIKETSPKVSGSDTTGPN